jgi:hypothetical protein
MKANNGKWVIKLFSLFLILRWTCKSINASNGKSFSRIFHSIFPQIYNWYHKVFPVKKNSANDVFTEKVWRVFKKVVKSSLQFFYNKLCNFWKGWG